MSTPSTVEQAIKIRYGVRIPVTPCDLKLRKFKIDELFNGFVLKGDGIALFGTIIGGETWFFSKNSIEWIECEHKANKELRFEWLVWEAARAMIEKGDRLGRDDGERLALAVQRLEAGL
jgi:hypothetical protein